MNEQKLNLIFTNFLIFFVILLANFFLFLLMKFFGFEYKKISTVCFFIFTFFTLSTLMAIIIENSINQHQQFWKRQLWRICLIPMLNFLIIIGLLLGLPSLVLPPIAIFSISIVSFIGESLFMYWLNIESD